MKNYLIRGIPDETLKALKFKAIEEETTMKELILKYIEEGLKKTEQKPKRK